MLGHPIHRDRGIDPPKDREAVGLVLNETAVEAGGHGDGLRSEGQSVERLFSNLFGPEEDWLPLELKDVSFRNRPAILGDRASNDRGNQGGEEESDCDQARKDREDDREDDPEDWKRRRLRLLTVERL